MCRDGASMARDAASVFIWFDRYVNKSLSSLVDRAARCKIYVMLATDLYPDSCFAQAQVIVRYIHSTVQRTA